MQVVLILLSGTVLTLRQCSHLTSFELNENDEIRKQGADEDE